jgi:hypothetical protein
MPRPASPRQIGIIHALAKRLRLDEEVRRDLIERETGKRSSKDLTVAEAIRVIDVMKGLVGAAQTAIEAASPRSFHLAGRYAGKLRALWISGWNLGVVHDRTDKALIHFIERQTGLSHPRFLHEPAEAAKAIEGLKAWLAREAGVIWPGSRDADSVNLKQAVIEAQRARLAEIGVMPAVAPDEDAHLSLDTIAEALGRQLRRALDPRVRREECHAASA